MFIRQGHHHAVHTRAACELGAYDQTCSHRGMPTYQDVQQVKHGCMYLEEPGTVSGMLAPYSHVIRSYLTLLIATTCMLSQCTPGRPHLGALRCYSPVSSDGTQHAAHQAAIAVARSESQCRLGRGVASR